MSAVTSKDQPAELTPAGALFSQLQDMADDRLSAASNAYLIPQSKQMLAACWTSAHKDAD